MRKAVAAQVAGYTAPGEDVYAGATAKAIVWAQKTGANPRTYGGRDLVAQLNRRVADNGRISDQSAWGDYANVVGQVFATNGLMRASSSKRYRAVSFLLKQQCTPGYFRLDFTKDPAAADQSCDGGDPATTSAPDTDVTAMAVIYLQDLPTKSERVRTAIRKASGWLVRRQRDNGSFGGGPTTEGSNANSTGLAAWALGDVNRCTPARDAARWVNKLHLHGDLSGTKLRWQRGAIAYDWAALRAGRTDGITVTTRDQWRRTTSQAAPGLLYLNGCR